MSDLVLRKIPFDFDDVEFVWNPTNLPFSMMMNSVTFQAIGFEQYMCRAMRDAEEFMTDPAIKSEARTFSGQESIHSQAHRKHAKALIARYPALQEVLDESIAGFDAIYKSEDLHFHLAFAADIEATFTPLFGTIIEHREILFGGGDPRVAALMLWHFCEEIEHRSSALTVYKHVVRRPLYRTGQFRKVLGHIAGNAKKIRAGFQKHIPSVPASAYEGALKNINIGPRARMIAGILESQMPWHNPQRGRVPAYYRTWRERYERGEDMSVANDLPRQSEVAQHH
jgi:predicted metal-dependent hydrolase